MESGESGGNVLFLKEKDDFISKCLEIFDEYDSFCANTSFFDEFLSYEKNEKRMQRIGILDKVHLHFLKNLHIVENPLFTENIESKLKFINLVLKKMESYLENEILNRPYNSFENENLRDIVMDFKARSLLVHFEFAKLKEKVLQIEFN